METQFFECASCERFFDPAAEPESSGPLFRCGDCQRAEAREAEFRAMAFQKEGE